MESVHDSRKSREKLVRELNVVKRDKQKSSVYLKHLMLIFVGYCSRFSARLIYMLRIYPQQKLHSSHCTQRIQPVAEIH